MNALVSKAPNGADLVADERDRETRARLLAKLVHAKAALEFDLANRANRITKPLEDDLQNMERRFGT